MTVAVGSLDVAPEVAHRFPDVAIRWATATVGRPAAVQAEADRLWAEGHERWKDVSRSELRRHPMVMAYRGLAERLGHDPDRRPPSVQSLVDRGLRNKPPGRWPHVSPVVDLLNATAVATMVALGAFDADRVTGAVRLRFSVASEPFHALGAAAPAPLEGDRLVLADDARVLSLFCERDGVHQAVRPDTTSLLVLGGVTDGIEDHIVAESIKKLTSTLCDLD